ncbi:MAG: hypothetical protein MH252_09115 [Thermosynechococcaceae cyanobacterium MS004]|nr:hypothetical protein [Thermosynechococcaceae cyanobacterium MS004]
MQEFIDNGTRLGLLIDHKNLTVQVYPSGRSPKTLEHREFLRCDPEFLGFTLQMAKVW